MRRLFSQEPKKLREAHNCLPFGGIALFAGVIACGMSFGATKYVATNGSDGGDGTSDSPYLTIQKGLDECGRNGTVIVSPGTYLIETQLEPKDGVTLRSSTWNPDDVVIDCQGKCAGYYARSVGLQRIFCVTFENGFSPSSGAGVYLFGGGMHLVSNCVVRNCRVVAENGTALGGGIYARQGTTIRDSLIENCSVSNVVTDSKQYNCRGGGVFIEGKILNSTVRGCSVWGAGNGWYETCSGGGIYAYSTLNADTGALSYAGRVEKCEVYSNRVVTLAVASKGDGGGITFVGADSGDAPQGVYNSAVWDNQASFRGGGISLSVKGDVQDCRITGNIVDPSLGAAPTYGGGGGIVVRKTSSATIARCTVASNESRFESESANKSGGGSMYLFGENLMVSDCVITNNVSSGRGAVVWFGKNDGGDMQNNVFSNCFIFANRATTTGVFNGNEGDGLSVLDCAVISNAVSGGSVLFWARTGSKNREILFRNTLFRGNANTSTNSKTGNGLYGMTTAANAPVHIEYCSFINDSCAYSSGHIIGMHKDLAAVAASNFWITGCLIYGDSQHTEVDISSQMVNNGAHITHTYAVGAPTDDPSLGNFNGKTTVPGFVNEAAGDYRLNADSPLIDKGGPAADWMGCGRRKGPHDLGDGTVCFSKSADCGVVPVFNEARPRLYNGLPDIGCFEFFRPAGLLLMVQ